MAKDTETFAVQCPHCSKVVDMLVKAQWSIGPTNDSEPLQWTAGQCPRCQDSSLFIQEYYGEQQFPPDGWDDPVRLYPPPTRRLSMEVPRSLREDYAEATKCLESKAYKAAAVMARRIVEGITVEQGYDEGDLFNRLKKMKTDGVIDERLYDWADICRDVGNQGAHASKTAVERRDAQEALEFAEALLDYLYVFQEKYEESRSADRRRRPRTPCRQTGSDGDPLTRCATTGSHGQATGRQAERQLIGMRVRVAA